MSGVAGIGESFRHLVGPLLFGLTYRLRLPGACHRGPSPTLSARKLQELGPMNTSWDAAHELGASVFIVIPCAVQRDAVRDLIAGSGMLKVPDQLCIIAMLHSIPG